jgi:hypothetical protein
MTQLGQYTILCKYQENRRRNYSSSSATPSLAAFALAMILSA